MHRVEGVCEVHLHGGGAGAPGSTAGERASDLGPPGDSHTHLLRLAQQRAKDGAVPGKKNLARHPAEHIPARDGADTAAGLAQRGQLRAEEERANRAGDEAGKEKVHWPLQRGRELRARQLCAGQQEARGKQRKASGGEARKRVQRFPYLSDGGRCRGIDGGWWRRGERRRGRVQRSEGSKGSGVHWR